MDSRQIFISVEELVNFLAYAEDTVDLEINAQIMKMVEGFPADDNNTLHNVFIADVVKGSQLAKREFISAILSHLNDQKIYIDMDDLFEFFEEAFQTTDIAVNEYIVEREINHEPVPEQEYAEGKKVTALEYGSEIAKKAAVMAIANHIVLKL